MNFFERFRETQRPYCTAVVAAAGSSSRMGALGNKLLLELDGIPVLARTLMALDAAGWVDAVVIAAQEAEILSFSELCRTYGIRKPVKIVKGGANRETSVLCAALEADPQTRLIAVHDGARPFAEPELIDRVIQKAARCNAAAPAIPVKDTIKQAEGEQVTATLERSQLRAIQTPQVFEADLLKAALQAALDSGAALTDDCSAVERLGKIVYLVDGDEENIKITTPLDLVIGTAILEERRRRR